MPNLRELVPDGLARRFRDFGRGDVESDPVIRKNIEVREQLGTYRSLLEEVKAEAMFLPLLQSLGEMGEIPDLGSFPEPPGKPRAVISVAIDLLGKKFPDVKEDFWERQKKKRQQYEQAVRAWDEQAKALREYNGQLSIHVQTLRGLRKIRKERLGDEPTIIRANQRHLKAALPAVFTFELGDQQYEVDVPAIRDKDAFQDLVREQQLFPQVIFEVTDSSAELGSARFSVRVEGPSHNSQVQPGEEIADGAILENRQVLTRDGQEIPLFTATIGQITSDIARRVYEASGRNVYIPSDKITQLLSKVAESSTFAAAEVTALYQNAAINERIQASLSQHGGQALLSAFARRLLVVHRENLENPLNKILLALESGRIRSYIDLRMAVIAASLNDKSIFTGFLDGSLDTFGLLERLYDQDRGLLLSGVSEVPQENVDTRAVARVTSEGSSVLTYLGRETLSQGVVRMHDLLLIFSAPVLDGLFETAAAFEETLNRYGRATGQHLHARMDMLAEKEEIAAEGVKRALAQLRKDRPELVRKHGEQLYGAVREMIEAEFGRLEQLKMGEDRTTSLPSSHPSHASQSESEGGHNTEASRPQPPSRIDHNGYE